MGTSYRDFDIDCGAVEQADGSYLNKYGEITWYNEEGEWHREDGPAVISILNGEEWRLNGEEYSFDAWLIKLNKTDECKMMLRLQYA